MAASTGRRFAGLLVGLVALGAPALACAQESQGLAQVETGLALEASLGARFGIIASSATDTTAFGGTALQTGLVGGYKWGRLLLGLGLELSNFTTSITAPGALGGKDVTTKTSDSAFLIGPDLQAALVRTADGKVELLGDLSLHFGHASSSTSVSGSSGTSPPTDSNFLLSYVIAPGVRYWIHPHFAFQALAGFGGDAFVDIAAGKTPMEPNHSEHGILTSFGALGVF